MKAKEYLSCLLGAAMLSGQIFTGSISNAAERDKVETAEYIVQTATEKQYDNLASQYEDQISAEGAEKKALEEENIIPLAITEKEAEKLDGKRGVLVEENTILSAESETSQYQKAVRKVIKQQWNKKAVGMGKSSEDDSRRETAKEGKIRMAVLDSGIDPMDTGSIAETADLVSDESMGDSTGHGTVIANIIKQGQDAANPGGLLPADTPVELISVKILDVENKSPISRVIAALEWCLANDIDIVNMSFGMKEESEILHSEIEKLEQAGLLMVAAAGNNGEKKDNSVEYPAAYPEVIAVGSVNQEMQESPFSAQGKEIEIAAPGEDIPITSCWGLQGTGSGTSYAAPHVAAAASLLWSKHPEKKAADIRKLLCQSAERPTATSRDTSGDHQKSGHGIVNYRSAKELLDSGWEDDQKNASAEKAEETSEKDAQNNHDTNGICGINNINEENNGCHQYEIPQAVQGSWAYNHHQHLITTHGGERAINAKQRDIAREVSYYVDMNDDMKKYNVLHARGQTNYVSAIYCLFEAARKWGGSITSQAQLASWMNNYKSNISESEHEDYRKKVIKHLSNAAERATTRVFEKGSSKAMPKATSNAIRHDNIIRGRMQLLGFAIHLAGDIYAHKSMCVTDNFASIAGTTFVKNNGSVKTKPSQHFINGTTSSISKKIEKGNTTTAALGKEHFSSNYYWLANKAYTDSINYMPQRYNVATKNATNYMIKNFCNNVTFSFYTFCPLATNKNYKYKTKYLTKYLTQTVNGFYTKYNSYSQAQWEALSHN